MGRFRSRTGGGFSRDGALGTGRVPAGWERSAKKAKRKECLGGGEGVLEESHAFLTSGRSGARNEGRGLMICCFVAPGSSDSMAILGPVSPGRWTALTKFTRRVC